MHVASAELDSQSFLLSGPGFERVTDTPDGTALRTRTRLHAAALQDDSQNDFR
jgi:hypothetical protein